MTNWLSNSCWVLIITWLTLWAKDEACAKLQEFLQIGWAIFRRAILRTGSCFYLQEYFFSSSIWGDPHMCNTFRRTVWMQLLIYALCLVPGSMKQACEVGVGELGYMLWKALSLNIFLKVNVKGTGVTLINLLQFLSTQERMLLAKVAQNRHNMKEKEARILLLVAVQLFCQVLLYSAFRRLERTAVKSQSKSWLVPLN